MVTKIGEPFTLDFSALLNQVRRTSTIIVEGRPFNYSDSKGEYVEIERTPSFSREVSNIESFAAYIREEARRRNNLQGDKFTVTFNSEGAEALLNDEATFSQHTISYDRQTSPQWDLIAESTNGKSFNHRELLRLFAQLKPSFAQTDYQSLLSSFRSVSFDAKTNVSSALLDTGKSGKTEMKVEFNSDNGTSKQTLPAQLLVNIQYARGSKRTYIVELEIEPDLKKGNGDKQEISFKLHFAQKENTVNQAISEELEDFREAVKDLPLLLIVENF